MKSKRLRTWCQVLLRCVELKIVWDIPILPGKAWTNWSPTFLWWRPGNPTGHLSSCLSKACSYLRTDITWAMALGALNLQICMKSQFHHLTILGSACDKPSSMLQCSNVPHLLLSRWASRATWHGMVNSWPLTPSVGTLSILRMASQWGPVRLFVSDTILSIHEYGHHHPCRPRSDLHRIPSQGTS